MNDAVEQAHEIGSALEPSIIPRSKHSRSRLASHVLSYGSASYISAALNAVRGVLIARILGPDNYGVWSVLTLVLVWSQFADFGMASAVSRQLPVLRAEGDTEGARRVTAVSLGIKIGATFLVAIGVIVASVFVDSPSLREGLLVVAGLALLQGIQGFGASVLLVSRRVAEAGKLLVVFAVLNFIAPVGGAFVGGLRGVWYGLGIALAVAAILYLRAMKVRPTLRFKWPELRELAAVGLPMAALALISYNLVNIDQLVIVRMLGSKQLAFYTIALTVGGLLYVIPSSLASILGPHLIERWRAGKEDIERLAWEPVRLLRDTYWIPVLAAMLVVAPAVRLILPDYEAGIRPALIYLPGAYLLGINLGASTFLLAIKRHWANVPLTIAVVVASLALEMLFVRLGFGLAGVALGSTCGYLVYTVAHLFVIRTNLRDSWPQAASNVLRMVLPALAWAIVLLSGAVLPQVTWLVTVGLFAIVYVLLFVVPHAGIYTRMLGVRR